ncbi:uncharacterized protein LOC116601131 [Nematostella vectensis]|uniref:uncharacterized protein LOC116601131 n=1 Tax=Nematostella vectensis TaxID=45351 RepID=UPI0020773BF3|nr:uncharacterized protein LOC116601131 [Nematostella vectensis]
MEMPSVKKDKYADGTRSIVAMLDLSNRGLRKIEPLPEGLSPQTLLYNNNEISKLENLQFFAHLQQLSLANNRLVEMRGISQAQGLKVLDLSNNSIMNIEGLSHLRSLEWLNLSGNSIKKIENLDKNINLSHLDLSDNSVSSLSDLTFLENLKTLLLHGNLIPSLRPVPEVLPKSIITLSLAENELKDLTEISFLSFLPALEQLSINSNPCVISHSNTLEFDYRSYIACYCARLHNLDGTLISSTERSVASSLQKSGALRSFSPGRHLQLITYLSGISPPVVQAEGSRSVAQNTQDSEESPTPARNTEDRIGVSTDQMWSIMRAHEGQSTAAQDLTIQDVSDSELSDQLESESTYLPIPDSPTPPQAECRQDPPRRSRELLVEGASASVREPNTLTDDSSTVQIITNTVLYPNTLPGGSGAVQPVASTERYPNTLPGGSGAVQPLTNTERYPNTLPGGSGAVQPVASTERYPNTLPGGSGAVQPMTNTERYLNGENILEIERSQSYPEDEPDDMSEPDPPIMTEEEAMRLISLAATIIQARVRGFLVRQRLHFQEYRARKNAAVVIQAAWRGYRARSYDLHVINARNEIRSNRQTAHINHLAMLVNRYKDEAASDRSKVTEAIKCMWLALEQQNALIQSLHSRERNRAAVTIQRMWRGYQARKVVPRVQMRTGYSAMVTLCKQLQQQMNALQAEVSLLKTGKHPDKQTEPCSRTWDIPEIRVTRPSIGTIPEIRVISASIDNNSEGVTDMDDTVEIEPLDLGKYSEIPDVSVPDDESKECQPVKREESGEKSTSTQSGSEFIGSMSEGNVDFEVDTSSANIAEQTASVEVTDTMGSMVGGACSDIFVKTDDQKVTGLQKKDEIGSELDHCELSSKSSQPESEQVRKSKTHNEHVSHAPDGLDTQETVGSKDEDSITERKKTDQKEGNSESSVRDFEGVPISSELARERPRTVGADAGESVLRNGKGCSYSRGTVERNSDADKKTKPCLPRLTFSSPLPFTSATTELSDNDTGDIHTEATSEASHEAAGQEKGTLESSSRRDTSNQEHSTPEQPDHQNQEQAEGFGQKKRSDELSGNGDNNDQGYSTTGQPDSQNQEQAVNSVRVEPTPQDKGQSEPIHAEKLQDKVTGHQSDPDSGQSETPAPESPTSPTKPKKKKILLRSTSADQVPRMRKLQSTMSMDSSQLSSSLNFSSRLGHRAAMMLSELRSEIASLTARQLPDVDLPEFRKEISGEGGSASKRITGGISEAPLEEEAESGGVRTGSSNAGETKFEVTDDADDKGKSVGNIDGDDVPRRHPTDENHSGDDDDALKISTGDSILPAGMYENRPSEPPFPLESGESSSSCEVFPSRGTSNEALNNMQPPKRFPLTLATWKDRGRKGDDVGDDGGYRKGAYEGGNQRHVEGADREEEQGITEAETSNLANSRADRTPQDITPTANAAFFPPEALALTSTPLKPRTENKSVRPSSESHQGSAGSEGYASPTEQGVSAGAAGVSRITSNQQRSFTMPVFEDIERKSFSMEDFMEDSLED